MASEGGLSDVVLRPRELLNLSGLLTLSRLPLAIIVPVFTYDRNGMLVILTLAVLTDVFDGPVARWRGTESRIGAVLDGWLDKIFFVNFGWSMVLGGFTPGILLIPWFIREIVQGITVPVLCVKYALGETPWPKPTMSGRITTIALVTAMVGGLLGLSWALYGASAVAGLSGTFASFNYLLRDRPFGTRPAQGMYSQTNAIRQVS